MDSVLEFFNKADVTIAAIIAVIGAFLALLQIKANIISTARINWAIKIRELTAELIASTLELQQNAIVFKEKHFVNKTPKEISELHLKFREANISNVIKIDQKCREILLHLNPYKNKNQDQRKFEELTNVWRDSLELEQIFYGDTWNKENTEIFQIEARKVIKRAWDDAKCFKIRELLRTKF